METSNVTCQLIRLYRDCLTGQQRYLESIEPLHPLPSVQFISSNARTTVAAYVSPREGAASAMRASSSHINCRLNEEVVKKTWWFGSVYWIALCFSEEKDVRIAAFYRLQETIVPQFLETIR